jgi:hypothetical protein
MSCVLVLLMAIVLFVSVVFWGASTPHFISKGRGYKKGNRIGYNMIPIRTLSLPAYFTYIFIDIIIYALGSTPWSSEIFWMMGRVVADPSLGLPSICGGRGGIPGINPCHGALCLRQWWRDELSGWVVLGGSLG